MNKDKDIRQTNLKKWDQVRALVDSRFWRKKVLVDAEILRHYPSRWGEDTYDVTYEETQIFESWDITSDRVQTLPLSRIYEQ